MIFSDEVGVAGSFEEIPSILIVIIATFLFLMSFAKGFASHSKFQEENEIVRRLESFANSILSFEPLLFQSEAGQLDSLKLNDNTRQLLLEHFHPDKLGFHFNLTLRDVSSYDEKYNWFAGKESPESTMIRSMLIPATVTNNLGQHHPVVLRITIWR